MKYFYLIVQKKVDDKHYAYVERVSDSCNLIAKFKNENVYSANICKTKKEAEEIEKIWNQGHLDNNRHLYGHLYKVV